MIADDCVDRAVIAHDLRNLLQIAGSALFQVDRLLDSATRERVRPYKYAATEALARAGLLSGALISPQANSESASIKPISIETVLLGIKPLIELAAGPDVRVAFHIANDIPSVSCSGRDLECAILNLVANARDAMPVGGTIDISLWRERSAAILYVQDNGGGMNCEIAAEAFRPNFTTKASLGGTGLGLAMVKRFAEQAGGQAEIDSAPGTGTTVTLRLPGIALV